MVDVVVGVGVGVGVADGAPGVGAADFARVVGAGCADLAAVDVIAAAGTAGGFASAGSNYFADSNVLSFVVEMPKTLLTSLGSGDVVAYWATTSTGTGH